MTTSTQDTTRKWTLDLGKIDDCGRGRKLNRVKLEVELRRRETVSPHLDVDLNPCQEFTELSIVGEVWNAAGTDITSGGQNRDTVAKHFSESPAVRRLLEIWERWHCNGMKPGTREQERYLADARVKVEYPKSQYEADCAVLEKANLRVVTGGPEVPNAHGAAVRRNYTYGSAWLCEPLPADVEAEVVRLCGELTANRAATAPECDPQNFAQEHNIHADVERVDSNPNMVDERGDMRHWKVTLRRGKARLTTYFSQGSAHTKKPTAIEVLGCLASDSRSADYKFEDWCSELGFDPDSRKHEAIFKTVQKQAAALKKFLGDDLYKELLDGVN
jgi:hypothetical protein